MKLALELSDRLIAISKSAKEDVVKTFGIPEEKVDVVYLGLDIDKFKRVGSAELSAFRKQFSLPEKYFLYIGTDYPHKNLAGLYRAFAQVMHRPELQGYSLVVAGNRCYQAGQRYLDRYLEPIRNRVMFLGHFPDEKIAHLYSAAEAFVYPSLYEGFGFPVLEAFACEVPLICSRATSLPEVAGGAAYMVDATDPAQIAKAMVEVASQPALRRELVRKGLAQVKKFTWEKCAQQTYAVYQRTLAEPQKNPAKRIESLKILLNAAVESSMGHFSGHPGGSSETLHAPSKVRKVLNPRFVWSKVRQVRSVGDVKKLIVSATALVKTKN